MALRTRVWSAGKLVLLVSGLFATYVIFAAASMRIALRSREVQIPNLTNHTANEATAIASALGLTLKVDDLRRPDAKIAAGRVLAQEPPAGSTAKANAGTVALLVNRGDRGASYVMPDLIGANGDRAAEILRNRGFRVAVVGSVPYPGVAAGIVIRQSPQAGFQVGPGEPISVEVSR